MNVTREHKLALIIGFSLVLVVLVLVGDHFSSARKSQPGSGLSVLGPRESGGAVVGNDGPGMGGTNGGSTMSPAGPGMNRTMDIAMVPPSSPSPGMGGAQDPAFVGTQYYYPVEEPTPIGGPGAGPVVQGGPTRPMSNESERVGQGQGHPLMAPTQSPRGSSESMPIPGFEPAAPRAPTSIDPTPAPAAPTKPLLPITKGKMQKRTVKEGETLYSLTEEVYGDGNLWPKLKDYNKGKIKADGSVREGVTLTFPPKDVLSGKAMLADETGTAGRQPGNGTPMPESRPTPLGKPERTGAIARGEPAAPPARNANTYTIQKGDALSTIAQKKLGSSKRWQELVDANPGVLDDPDSIPVGAVIRIPVSSGGAAHDSQR